MSQHAFECLGQATSGVHGAFEPFFHFTVEHFGGFATEGERVGPCPLYNMEGYLRGQCGETEKNREADGEQHAAVEAATGEYFHDLFRSGGGRRAFPEV